ncbi:lipoprotein [Dyella sp. BiH032]|uniref:LPS translocon maturation chaperone LptM n=1 Tax=Dyella sp. BiH032 TaxID=3075430 RepID=UPI002892E1F8|nr:lipoprotein [Dyella sp. BiH032]WNL46267.1 lipoprotein [Dyella sp. BiH032]
MRRSIPLLLLCVVMAALAGCGNKGPLFMPPPKPTPATTTAPAAPAPASTAATPAAH